MGCVYCDSDHCDELTKIYQKNFNSDDVESFCNFHNLLYSYTNFLEHFHKHLKPESAPAPAPTPELKKGINCTYCNSEHRLELEEKYFETEDLEAVRAVTLDRDVPFSKFHFLFHINQHLKVEKTFKNCPFCQSSIRAQLEQHHRDGLVHSHISRIAKQHGEKISTNQVKAHLMEHTNYVQPAEIIKVEELPEPQGKNTSLQLMKADTVRKLPTFHFDDFVELIQKGISEIYKNQIIICLKAQETYMNGEIPYPSEEMKWLVNLTNSMDKLLNYSVSTEVNAAMQLLISEGYTIEAEVKK